MRNSCLQKPAQRIIHGVGIASLGDAPGAQLVEGIPCQPIFVHIQRQSAAFGGRAWMRSTSAPVAVQSEPVAFCA